jgi:hypothetical protein
MAQVGIDHGTPYILTIYAVVISRSGTPNIDTRSV